MQEKLNLGIKESYLNIILGFILFIPGSYHIFIAFGALTRMHGYNYDNNLRSRAKVSSKQMID